MVTGEGVGRAAVIALLMLALSASAGAVLVDLGSYSVQDPRITVNYTEDVFLLSAALVNLDPGAEVREYALRQVPPKDPANPTYIRSYRLYTGTEDEPEYLVSGRYQLTLEALDRQGRPTLDIVEFTITGLEIVLLDPRFGFSPSSPFDVTIGTEIAGDPEPASCWYSRIGWDSGITRIEAIGTYASEHRIVGLAYTGFLYVSCTEQTGRETRQRFLIGRDSTPPSINASAIPPIVTDPRDKSAIVRAITDDNSTCSIDGEPFPQEDPDRAPTYRRVHEIRLYYNEITDTATHEMNHAISCANLAELSSDATLTVTVDFGAFIGINVLEPATAYVNVTTFALRVRPTFDASACTVNRGAMQERANEEWAATIPALNGKVALNISCSGQGKNATLEHNVTVDTVSPIVSRLAATSTECAVKAPKASAEWIMNDSGSGVASANYTLRQGSLVIAGDDTVLSRATVALPPGLNGTLAWTVFATDLAGNRGLATTADAACGTNTTLPPGDSCVRDTDCADGESCVAGACLAAVAGDTCANGLLDSDEEDVDCGGQCPACVVCFDDTECAFDEECGLSNVCVPATAGDGACVRDADCSFDEICYAGACVPADDGTTTPPGPSLPADEGIDWLAIVLIAVGLLLMGGAGWFLYSHDQEKRAREAQRSAQRPTQSSAQRDFAQQPAAVRPPAAPVRAPDRAAQRKRVLGAFADAKAGRAQEPVPKKEPAEDDVFEKLERIGRKREGKR